MNDTANKLKGFKSGFVLFAGAPNVGKSTLLNQILGEKISITSKKAQTTRNRILGVVHRPLAQFVFLDTPGVHKAKETLNIRMVDVAVSAIGDSDIVVFIIDLRNPEPESEQIILEKLKAQTKPVILAMNKTDMVKNNEVLAAIDKWQSIYSFQSIVPISAKHGDQVDILLNEMEKVLPQGPPYFPGDSITDMPEKFIAAEMIREKVFRLTGQEIPYSTAVTIDSFSESAKLVKIHATVHVERSSQKAIIIGKDGVKLRQIGEAARKDIEKLVGAKVFLKLFIRIQKNWSKDTKALRKFGY